MTQLTFISLGVIALSELLIWWRPLWPLRRWLTPVVIVALSVASGLLLANYLTVGAVLFSIFSAYRIMNLLRILQRRLQANHLYFATRQTAAWLIGLQFIVLGVAQFNTAYAISALSWFYILAVGQLLTGLVILSSTVRHLRTTRPPTNLKGVAERDLPSLTVAIPARNETLALENCLQSLTASTYPKLEILVLDDSSQNRHTPEIIRSFAHDGVRFLAGEVPPSGWLAKNFAYDQLADAANGEIILFCGVDTQFEPHSLTQLVKIMLQKQKTMLSILPRNLVDEGSLMSLLIQPSRYAWELALPRRLFKRPPVLSTCWLVKLSALKSVGGFEAVRHKCIPESYFARSLASQADGYSFLQSDQTIGITSHKELAEQQATAVRTRYPQLHRRPELVALTSLAELLVLFWPLITLPLAIVAGNWLLAALTGLAYLMQMVAFSKIVNLTYRRRIWYGWWLLPLAALHDLRLLNYSMWQYEFGEVIWKGRNVSIPIMQALPSLPKLD